MNEHENVNTSEQAEQGINVLRNKLNLGARNLPEQLEIMQQLFGLVRKRLVLLRTEFAAAQEHLEAVNEFREQYEIQFGQITDHQIISQRLLEDAERAAEYELAAVKQRAGEQLYELLRSERERTHQELAAEEVTQEELAALSEQEIAQRVLRTQERGA